MASPSDSPIICDKLSQIPDNSSLNQASKRKRFTASQLEVLNSEFEENHTPSYEIREAISKQLGMTNREVQVWFQNRRAKVNKQKSAPSCRFLYYPSMNIEDITNQPTSPPLHINPDTNNFHFVPVVVGQSESDFTKNIHLNSNRKIAPAPIKITSYDDNKMPFTAPLCPPNRYSIPNYISTFRRGHQRHYSYQGVPLGSYPDPRHANLPSVSPITPDHPTPSSDFSFKVNPEMVNIKPKSFSTTTLPSLKELGLESYQLPQVGPSKPSAYFR